MSTTDNVTLDLGVPAEGTYEIHIEGKLGWGADNAIRSMLTEKSGTSWLSQHVMLNLSDVGFLDSAGVSSLLTLHREVSDSGGKLVLYGASPRINQMFGVVGMHRVIPVVDDRQQAQEVCQA